MGGAGAASPSPRPAGGSCAGLQPHHIATLILNLIGAKQGGGSAINLAVPTPHPLPTEVTLSEERAIIERSIRAGHYTQPRGGSRLGRERERGLTKYGGAR